MGVLLKRWQKSQKKLDYLEIKKTLERLERGELSQNNRLTVLEDLEINQLDENLFEAPKVREEKSARNYIRENIK